MHDNLCPRRRRNQSEIDQLVQKFRTSGLSQHEFAQKIGVHQIATMVVRWIRTTSVDINHSPVGSPSCVVKSLPHRTLSSSPSRSGPDRGIRGHGLLAHVVLSKYLEHRPLYRGRQELGLLPVRRASPLPGGCRWLRAWLFGGSAEKIQQSDRLRKSG